MSEHDKQCCTLLHRIRRPQLDCKRHFSEGINCTGGTFNVTLNGRVIIDRTVYVPEGTTVQLIGADSESEMDGGRSVQIFNLVNASLHVVGMVLSNGNATYGGAIAATGSNITINNTTFKSNIASIDAGALYLDKNSLFAMNGQATFAENSAGSRGGGLFAGGGSSVLFRGSTSFLDNIAFTYGGAIFILESIVYWSAEMFFVNNTAYYGGGSLCVYDNSGVFWSANTSFTNNSGGIGGAIYVLVDSNVSWTAETLFLGNSAVGGSGGALYIDDGCSVWWEGGVTSFVGNASSWSGDALFVYDTSVLFWSTETFFVDNTAESNGGALYIHDSIISWSANTSFVNNSGGSGGALYVKEGSGVSWTAETSFINNIADSNGRALYIDDNSGVFWSANTSFVDNSGDFGGAILLLDGSNISWTAETLFLDNTAAAGSGGAMYVDDGCSAFVGNAANWSGGALFVYDSSVVSWSTETSFTNNSGEFGGAVFVQVNSDVSWTDGTSFLNNSAIAGSGGALYVDDGCSVWWEGGVTSFIGNSANWSGGALFVYNNSAVSWSTETTFTNNSGEFGGAVFVQVNSDVSWTDGTSFLNNSAVAGSGGALYIDDGCSVWWGGITHVIGNAANWSGGALLVYDISVVSWSAETLFENNHASLHGGAITIANGSIALVEASTTFSTNSASSFWGGAVFVFQNSYIAWDANTSFVSNRARAFGGGLASVVGSLVTMKGDTFFFDNFAGNEGGSVYIYHGDGEPQSHLTIHNTTVFDSNTCGGNGGGMALIGSVSVDLVTENMAFLRNDADVAGGAVYMSGVVFGPNFVGTRFVSNSAEMGGGVYITGSGTAVSPDIQGVPKPQDPSTFENCIFKGNEALTRGGALDSGAGIDLIVNTLFEGNTAGSGGALRLAGETSLDGCDFIENISDEDKGPAIYNEGFISRISDCRFVENVFNCDPTYYFAYNETEVGLTTVCKDCKSQCEDCVLEGNEPMCVEEFDHSSSPGGNTTVELLDIDPGYWRVSNTSTKILDCYNADACKGGVTGDPEYCLKGYEGPYCSVCSDGYTPSLGSSCKKCPDTTSSLGVALLVVLGMVVFAVFVVFLTYMLSGRERNTDRGIAACLSRFIPLHSLKIVVVVWQILTQFCDVVNFAFPDIYRDFLDGVDLLNFDLSNVISTGCIANIDFHDQLLITTLGPIIGMTILGATFAIAILIHRRSEAAWRVILNKHLTMVLLLTFLVYSSVSSTVFTTFVCDDLDDGTSYLRADYRIDCDSPEHEALEIYAGFMIIFYVIGIPALYATLLFSSRDTLTKDENREKNPSVTMFADLWQPYKPRFFFYELVECCRRVMLTGVVVFIYPNSAAQVAVALVMATTFFIISESLDPQASAWDTWVSRMGHAIVVTSMFLALLLKVDVSEEQAKSQRAFEAVLVATHVVMILVVMAEAGTMIVAWSKEGVSEDPKPRSKSNSGRLSFVNDIGSDSPEDEAPDCRR